MRSCGRKGRRPIGNGDKISGRKTGLIFAALSAALLLTAFPGCGKKADPVPPRFIPPPAVADLIVRAEDEGIRIEWTEPAHSEPIERVRIMRSELLVAGESCPGCPRTFNRIAELSPEEIEETEEGRASFLDRKVDEGVLYTYHIVICDSARYCGAESNQAEIKFRKKERNDKKSGNGE